MKARKLLICSLILVSGAWNAGAQFYSLGTERPRRWSTLETGTYRVIYPAGLDSLARVYAVNLEYAADKVGGSTGFRPGSSYRRKLPVVIHAFSTESNGMVTWAPSRMELLTTPDAYSPETTPWVQDLTIHESRHVSQMQFGNTKPFRIWNILTGQMAAGALSAVYSGPAFLEGDAVVAETALTEAGRGRSGDFLEYMRASSAAGLHRGWWQWRYGSQKNYTPDHYRIGYITIAGMRTVFDRPDFTKDYYDRVIEHHGFAFNNLGKTVKEATGLKFKDAFERISETLDSTWRADAAARAPYIPSEQVTPDTRRFTDFGKTESYGDSLYTVRSGLTVSTSLVKVASDGGQRRLSAFSDRTSRLQRSDHDGRIYWSETIYDPRWEMESWSDIHYLDYREKKNALTRHQRYFNPAPAPGKPEIAVTEYPAEGGCNVVIISSEDGSRLRNFAAPDWLQITETVWLDGRLFASGLSDEGFSIYEVPGFRALFQPLKAKINHLGRDGRNLTFTCDLSGVNEFYSLDTDNADITRLTSTAGGATDFRFHKDTLYYSVLEPDGRKIYRTPRSGLLSRKVTAADAYVYEMAEKLSASEHPSPDSRAEISVSETERYVKAAHLLRFHSWAPLFVDYDSVGSLSLETLQQTASLGVTAFFQNELATASGFAGIKLDPGADFRPSAHLRFDWKGWYPVIETSFHLNERNAVQYSMVTEEGVTRTKANPRIAALAKADAKIYIPLSWSDGGVLRGLVPQMNLSYTNDKFLDGGMSRVSASMRGWVMLSTPSSCIYPRLGIGAEIGYSARPAISDIFCANAYGYVYGYLPGIIRTHGIKLSALTQVHASDGILTETYASTAPRGFGYACIKAVSAYPYQTKLSFDYALPFAPVDWSGLCPLAYVRNFELKLHSDLSLYGVRNTSNGGNLLSAGIDLNARLGNFLWIPYDTRIGVSWNLLAGSGYSDMYAKGAVTGRNSVELIFSIDL